MDRKRGKIFTKHTHLIEVAARQGGGDSEMNASLRLAIDNARGDNMPRENIERAIKKGTGELKGEQQMQEVSYEAFGPAGVALVIEALTDNKNRTSQMVRTVLQKNGGNIGAIGSTSFLFKQMGVITVKSKADPDSDELEIIDAGAQDVERTDGGFCVYTAPAELMAVKKKLEEKGFAVENAELSKVPTTTVEIKDAATAKKVLDLVEALEEQDDVSEVFGNFEIGENNLKSFI